MATGQHAEMPLKKRSVVSSFIYEGQDGDPTKFRIALFRRSDKVSTYHIDESDLSPLAAAWRELREETTLDASSLELTRQGKPYTFADPSIGREWTIHAFAFRLRRPSFGGGGEAGIHIDWEHEGWGWYDPHAIVDTAEFGGVPRLAESFRRVWFERDLGEEAGAVLRAGLAALKNDHQSGARQLAAVALQVLRGVVAKIDVGREDAQPGPHEWWARVRFAAWHLWKNGRESMGAAIMSVLLAALKQVEQTLEMHTGKPQEAAKEWRDAVLETLDGVIALRGKDSTRHISESFRAYLDEHFASRQAAAEPIRILTLSESSTITACLCQAILETDYLFDLRVLESRPLYEGVSLAGSIVKEVSSAACIALPVSQEAPSPPSLKVKLTLLTDASAALAASEVDMVLLGADRIASSGDVSNKTGSLPAVLSAKHVSGSRCRTVVLGESEKVAPPGPPGKHVVEDNDAGQLVRAWHAELNSERVRQAAGTLSRSHATGTGQERDDGSGGAVPADRADGEGVIVDRVVQVEVRNVFFEWVPAELVDDYVTEQGPWTVKDIEEHSSRLGAEQERLFGDL